MSYQTLRQAVEGRFKTLWTYTPIEWPNQEFEPAADDHTSPLDPNDPWVRLTLVTGEAIQISVEETPLKRVVGFIIVQIFVKPNTGTGAATSLADNVRDIFEDQDFSNVVCRATTLNFVGDDGDWYQVNASTEFEYDYT